MNRESREVTGQLSREAEKQGQLEVSIPDAKKSTMGSKQRDEGKLEETPQALVIDKLNIVLQSTNLHSHKIIRKETGKKEGGSNKTKLFLPPTLV